MTFIQAFNCDVICMSPLSRSCGALSLSSICRSFFLPPGGSGGCGLDAADGDERPSSEAKRDWSDFLSCFLGLCCGYNKSVFFFLCESAGAHVAAYLCVCAREYDNGEDDRFRFSSSAPLRPLKRQRGGMKDDGEKTTEEE